MKINIKYLEMIQAVIIRMAGNSFQLKTWSVTLVAAIFLLAARQSSTAYFLVAYFPAIMFWYLDAYFLRRERAYRKLFSNVAEERELELIIDLDASKYLSSAGSLRDVAFSETLLVFYGAIVGAISLTMLVSLAC